MHVVDESGMHDPYKIPTRPLTTVLPAVVPCSDVGTVHHVHDIFQKWALFGQLSMLLLKSPIRHSTHVQCAMRQVSRLDTSLLLSPHNTKSLSLSLMTISMVTNAQRFTSIAFQNYSYYSRKKYH